MSRQVPIAPTLRGLRPRLVSVAAVVAVSAAAGLVAVSVAPVNAAPLSPCYSSDNGDPDLQGFAISPGSVNVTSGAKLVTFTIDAADTGGPGAATGIGSGSVQVRSEDFLRYASATLKLSSGKWVGTATIPQWTHAGTWHVSILSLSDKAGNYAYWFESDLIGLGYPTTLTVTATPDDTAPKLTGLGFSPGSVDTRQGVKKVTVTAKATDGQSGIASIFVGAGEPGTTHASYASLAKVAGVANTYRGSMTVPRWVTNGTWRVSQVYVTDRVGNSQIYAYADLVGAAFKRSFVVVSGSDGTAPVLASFARTPGTVDVRTANKTVGVTLRAKDGASGVVYAIVRFGYFSTALKRVSGTPKDGIWKGNVTILRCVAANGTAAATVTLYDAGGNKHDYSAAALKAKGWPSNEVVKARDNTVATAALLQTNPAPADSLVVTFNEAVNGITTATGVVELANTGASVAGTWSCLNASNAATDCATGQVRKATFDPTADLTAFTSYYLRLNPEHELGVTDLAGNPFDRLSLFFFTTS